MLKSLCLICLALGFVACTVKERPQATHEFVNELSELDRLDLIPRLEAKQGL